jgi:cytoskeletal protein RodZ
MFEIGTSLRQARQHRALEIADVERETRIRAKYLVALEEERFAVLPGIAYVRGFLRTYAEFLGLDGNLLVDEYNQRFAPPEDELPPIQPNGLGGGGRRFGQPMLGVLAAALTFGVIAVWQLGFTSAERTPIPQAQAAAPLVPRVPATRPKAKPSAAPRRVAAGTGELVVRAVRGPCWVGIRIGSAAGPVIYQQVVGQGSVVRFTLKQALWVRLGAPWNADVSVRGKQLPAFPRTVVNLRAV